MPSPLIPAIRRHAATPAILTIGIAIGAGCACTASAQTQSGSADARPAAANAATLPPLDCQATEPRHIKRPRPEHTPAYRIYH
jgi:hypothetical protein